MDVYKKRRDDFYETYKVLSEKKIKKINNQSFLN